MTGTDSSHDATGTEKLLVHVSDEGIATITFNNPEKRNALSTEMRTALVRSLVHLGADAGVRVVVLRGAGDKAFVSGADISEFGERRNSPEARAEVDALSSAVDRAFEALEKPVIAMIRGFCIGGGLATALYADIRIAADDARFAIPAAKLGIGYPFSSTKNLVDLVGWAWTAEILYSARQLSPDEALRIGLVNRVVPVDQLEAQTTELARAIAANAPLTVATAKAAIRQVRRDPDDRDLNRIGTMVEGCYESADFQEGQVAFAEKRSPRFQGR